MGLLDSAFNGLKGILGGGSTDHLDLLHDAINDVENDPSKLSKLIGQLSNHPELGDQVQSWLGTPQAKSVLDRLKTLGGADDSSGDQSAKTNSKSGSGDDTDTEDDSGAN